MLGSFLGRRDRDECRTESTVVLAAAGSLLVGMFAVLMIALRVVGIVGLVGRVESVILNVWGLIVVVLLDMIV